MKYNKIISIRALPAEASSRVVGYAAAVLS